MKSLLLTVLLLGLVAVLKAQEAPSDDQEDFSGIWYTKAAVCDRNHTDRNKPMKVFPMTVTALEGEDLEVQITFWRKGQCHMKKILMHKTEEPRKYTAFRGKKVFYIHEIPVKDHCIFYYEGQNHGKSHRKGKLVGRDPEENPEAMEEFKKFVKSKGFQEKNIFVPEQLDQCVAESD
ncbi:odorant-binding protein 2a-like [Arvicanthis niloticus]|uniref:odorant-binding protein 2a-like n=1 Tax=Arvicanthis niloticus TaxID=61156 RepID=UPI0014874FFE|nr:odorant-binding protein 2a-like [Arvicanthis niloticus]